MWGVTGAAYLRLKEPEYEDGVGTPRYVKNFVYFCFVFPKIWAIFQTFLKMKF
jgi:hypothetical protein